MRSETRVLVVVLRVKDPYPDLNRRGLSTVTSRGVLTSLDLIAGKLLRLQRPIPSFLISFSPSNTSSLDPDASFCLPERIYDFGIHGCVTKKDIPRSTSHLFTVGTGVETEVCSHRPGRRRGWTLTTFRCLGRGGEGSD